MSEHQDKRVRLDEADKDAEDEIGSNTLTEAEKFLLTLKEHFMWSILTTTDKLHPAPRVVNLHHIPEFGFLITTRSYYSKMEQIAKNPIGTISIYPGNEMDTAVAHVSLCVTNDQKVLDAAWDDYMLKLGYSGKTDEIYRVILIKVHSVTFGKDTYSGVPIDRSLYDHIAQDEVAPLPSGPFKTKEISELLKKTFNPMKIGNLITMNGLEHDCRIMEVRYKEDIGLYATTGGYSKKIKQIRANANVALLVEDKQKLIQIGIDAVANISTCLDLKKKVWEDKYIQYGYSGADDEKLVVILFTVRRVSIHSMASRVPEVLVAEPIQYDKDLQMMNSLSQIDIPVHLTTVDENGVPHSRLVNTVVFHPVLGYMMGSHSGSKKTLQLEHNSHAVITTYKQSTGDSFTIEADIVAQNEKQFLLATWKPFLAAQGFKGAEDPARTVLQVNTKKAEYVNVKDFYAGLRKK